MLDLLLVNPLFLKNDPVERRLMTPYFPLGLLYLAGAAREAGYRVAVFDAMFYDHENAFFDVLRKDPPRIVGISALATTRRSALRLAEAAKDFGSSVILGGADPTGRPEFYLQHKKNSGHPVDVVVIGEGEQTLIELLAVMSPVEGDLSRFQSIRGIAWLDSEHKVQFAPDRPLMDSIDGIPRPAWDLVEVERYRQTWLRHHKYFSLPLMTARGCPYNCSWCQKNVFGRSFRQHSPDRVADEMLDLKQRYAPDQLRIVDDVLGIHRSWIGDWHMALQEREAEIPFECLCRADLLDEEVVNLLKAAGCRQISLGAESGSQRILDAMCKEIKVEQIRKATEICRKNGISVYFYIMLGYPGEEWRDIKATIALLRETVPDAFSMTVAYPLSGTAFYEEVKDRLLESPDWDYSAENRLIYERQYSTEFYRWVQKLIFKEWNVCRRSWRGEWRKTGERLFQVLTLWALRMLVFVLRFLLIGKKTRRYKKPSESESW
jgi:radical SAM superfamily enzyme YgiQ (UPF0313 family)